MTFHGNSGNNPNKHHLYAIYDIEEDDVFKYGISDSEIKDDGYSRRMREQVDYLNRAVGWIRYRAEVLRDGVVGKTKAIRLEEEYIDAYREKNGHNPRGNIRRTQQQREES